VCCGKSYAKRSNFNGGYYKMTLPPNKRWESAKADHLFLNDIKDSVAREFIIAMFHKIEDLERNTYG